MDGRSGHRRTRRAAQRSFARGAPRLGRGRPRPLARRSGSRSSARPARRPNGKPSRSGRTGVADAKVGFCFYDHIPVARTTPRRTPSTSRTSCGSRGRRSDRHGPLVGLGRHRTASRSRAEHRRHRLPDGRIACGSRSTSTVVPRGDARQQRHLGRLRARDDERRSRAVRDRRQGPVRSGRVTLDSRSAIDTPGSAPTIRRGDPGGMPYWDVQRGRGRNAEDILMLARRCLRRSRSRRQQHRGDARSRAAGTRPRATSARTGGLVPLRPEPGRRIGDDQTRSTATFTGGARRPMVQDKVIHGRHVRLDDLTRHRDARSRVDHGRHAGQARPLGLRVREEGRRSPTAGASRL